MFRISFSKKALDYIIDEQQNSESEQNELILKTFEDLVIHGYARAVIKNISSLLNLTINLYTCQSSYF